MTEQEHTPRTATIRTGTLFVVASEEYRVDMIRNMGMDNDSFFTVQVNYDEEGQPWIASWIAGTASPKHIKEIVEEWTPEQILSSLHRGLDRVVQEPWYNATTRDRYVDNMMRYIAEGPKTITLDR